MLRHSPIRRPFAALLAGVLCAHAVLGCCSHHAHASGADVGGTGCCDGPKVHDYADCPCTSHGEEDEDQLGNHCSSASLPASDDPFPLPQPSGHTCEGDKCSFLACWKSMRRSAESLCGTESAIGATVWLPASSHAATVVLRRGVTSPLPGAIGSSPRPHLLLQVLLV
ncbi:MAG: hypothetical protein ACC645_03580 [Pirellulales bacterium]